MFRIPKPAISAESPGEELTSHMGALDTPYNCRRLAVNGIVSMKTGIKVGDDVSDSDSTTSQESVKMAPKSMPSKREPPRKFRMCWSCETTEAKGPWHGHKYEEGKFLCGECFEFHKKNSQNREEVAREKTETEEMVAAEANQRIGAAFTQDVISLEAAFNAAAAVANDEHLLMPSPQERTDVMQTDGTGTEVATVPKILKAPGTNPDVSRNPVAKLEITAGPRTRKNNNKSKVFQSLPKTIQTTSRMTRSQARKQNLIETAGILEDSNNNNRAKKEDILKEDDPLAIALSLMGEGEETVDSSLDK